MFVIAVNGAVGTVYVDPEYTAVPLTILASEMYPGKSYVYPVYPSRPIFTDAVPPLKLKLVVVEPILLPFT